MNNNNMKKRKHTGICQQFLLYIQMEKSDMNVLKTKHILNDTST